MSTAIISQCIIIDPQSAILTGVGEEFIKSKKEQKNSAPLFMRLNSLTFSNKYDTIYTVKVNVLLKFLPRKNLGKGVSK